MPRRTGSKMIRLRDDFIDVIDQLRTERNITYYSEVEAAAGIQTKYNTLSGRERKNSRVCNLAAVCARMRSNGYASTNSGYITQLEAWAGVKLAHEKPQPLFKAAPHQRKTTPVVVQKKIWIEVAQSHHDNKVSVDLACEADVINLQEFIPLTNRNKYEALVFAQMWADRLKCELDNFLPKERKQFKSVS